MKLLDSFFSVQNQQEDSAGNVLYHISLNPEHEIFKAHFPGNPIVPGVCQVQMARELLSEIVASPLSLVEVKNIKYLSVMTPTEHLEYDVTFKKTDIQEDKVKTTAMYESDGQVYAKMSLVFTKEK